MARSTPKSASDVRRSQSPGHRSAFLTTSWDDGTPEDIEIGRLLSRYGYRGTFYATTGPEGRRTIDDAGIYELVSLDHEYGNHGRTHRPFVELSTRELLEEVEWAESEIRRFAEPGVVVAPPKGATAMSIVQILNARGLTVRTAPILGTGQGRRGVMVPTAHLYPHSTFLMAQQLVRRHAVPAIPFLKAWARSLTARERFRRMVQAADSHALVLHLWGHSREIATLKLWRDLEFLLEEAAEHELRAATNSDLARSAGRPR